MADGPRTKTDRIVDELRARIATGELARGTRIQQDETARRFHTSITPVREALRQLEAEGVLVGEPHRGVRVAGADLEEIKGVYVARRLLEPYAAQRAALRVTRRELGQAIELTDAMEVAGREGDVRALLDANRRFHFLFYDRCGVPSLLALIEELWLKFPWDVLHVVEGRAALAPDEHRRLVAAMEAGDLQRVAAEAEDHIRNSYLAVARHLGGAAAPDVFDVDVD